MGVDALLAEPAGTKALSRPRDHEDGRGQEPLAELGVLLVRQRFDGGCVDDASAFSQGAFDNVVRDHGLASAGWGCDKYALAPL